MLYSRFSRMNANTAMGNTTTTSQAPSVNFTIAKITTTSAVYTPPMKLMTSRRRQAGSLPSGGTWPYRTQPSRNR